LLFAVKSVGRPQTYCRRRKFIKHGSALIASAKQRNVIVIDTDI